jgi:hypothetical protein
MKIKYGNKWIKKKKVAKESFINGMLDGW